MCIDKNLSQSKVTGILVEEALHARNLFNAKKDNYENGLEINEDSNISSINDEYKSDINKNQDISYEEEYKYIKEYVKYKNFKKILSVIESEN